MIKAFSKFKRKKCREFSSLAVKKRAFTVSASKRCTVQLIRRVLYYRKIPKISPGGYIFQRSFLRGLFLEGPIFGGAYARREIAFQNRLG